MMSSVCVTGDIHPTNSSFTSGAKFGLCATSFAVERALRRGTGESRGACGRLLSGQVELAFRVLHANRVKRDGGRVTGGDSWFGRR